MSEVWTPAALWLVRISIAASLLILLTLLLARFTRQPARRQRLCEAGLAAALLATAVSLAPAWLVIGLPVGAQEKTVADAGVPPEEFLDLRPDPNALIPENQVAELPSDAKSEPDLSTSSVEPARISLKATIPLFLLAVYGTGTVFFLLRWLGGWLVLRRLLRDTEAAPAALFEMLGIPENNRPRLLVSRKLRAPISCGVWRPTVVLPIDFCRPGDHAGLRWVFAHELTHIERKDALSAVLFALGQVVFFHLPWFWMLRKQVRLCQEYVADAAAVAERPADEYAEFLLTLTENQALPLLTTGVGGPVSDLFRRVTMLLQNSFRVEKRCPRLWTWGLACGLLAVAVLLGGVGLRAAAADTIIIIIPGKQAAEPSKDKAADAKKTTAPINFHAILFTDKGTIQAKPVDAVVDPTNVPVRTSWLANLLVNSGLEYQQPTQPVKEDPEKLKKVIQDLEGILKTRPDTKELREMIERLKGLQRKTAVRQIYQNAYPVDPNKRDLYQWGVFPYPLANPAGVIAVKVPPGQVDWKKLEQLLEKIQKTPDRIDPKEISKALEEIRKAAGGVAKSPYHVPIQSNNDNLKWIYSALAKPGAKGRFGIRFSPPSNDLRDYLGLPKDQGLMIEEVDPGSPAAKAGLKIRDIILKLNDQPVPSDTNKASKLFTDVKDGASVDLTILRRGKEEVIKGVKPAGPDVRWLRQTARQRLLDDLEKKGALVTILTDAGKFNAKYQEKQLLITIKGAVKSGKGAIQEVLIEVEGKEAYKGAAAGVPEAWRSRVQRLMQLIRNWQIDLPTRAPDIRSRDPLPKAP
jgi:hypothetical protein